MSHREAIEARLRQLDYSPDAPEFAVEKWASKIQLSCLRRLNEARPFAREVSGKSARDEIAEYQDLCFRLHQHVFSMSKTAIDALKANKGKLADPLNIGWQMLDHSRLSVAAYNSIDPLKRPKGGAPRLHYAPAVASAVAGAYWEITGKRPTVSVNPVTYGAYGPFLELLTDIFGVLSIEASPESQAKAAAKAFSPP